MTSPYTPDPTGATGPPPGAGTRLPIPESPVSEHRDPGGLLRVGTRVEVTVFNGDWAATGEIVDTGSVPAAYLSIDRGDGRRVVVFTGPGVIVEPPPPWHPGTA